MITLAKMPSLNIFMGSGPFSQSPKLGQWAELISIATGVLQAAPAAMATYAAKRAADRAKQDRKRRDEEARAQEAADAEAQAKAQEEAKARAAAEQGLTPQGTPLGTNKILGLDPMVLAVGGIGIVGIGFAIYMSMKK